jgi:hypothetical protein
VDPSTAPTTTPASETPYAVPPQGEWEGILTNARAKAAEDARRELAEQYGPLTPDLWQSHFKSYFEGLQNNPVEFHRWLGDQLARRGLTVSPAPAAPTPTPPMTLPQPSLFADAGNGRTIPAYSADDVNKVIEHALHVERERMNRELSQRLEPLEATAHDAKVTRIMTVANQHAAAAIAEAETWPYFGELREDIAKIMAADKRFSFEGAYTRALKEKWPAYKSQARAAFLDELGRAPAATTAIDPSRPAINSAKADGRLTLEEKFDRALNNAFGR